MLHVTYLPIPPRVSPLVRSRTQKMTLHFGPLSTSDWLHVLQLSQSHICFQITPPCSPSTQQHCVEIRVRKHDERNKSAQNCCSHADAAVCTQRTVNVRVIATETKRHSTLTSASIDRVRFGQLSLIFRLEASQLRTRTGAIAGLTGNIYTSDDRERSYLHSTCRCLSCGAATEGLAVTSQGCLTLV